MPKPLAFIQKTFARLLELISLTLLYFIGLGGSALFLNIFRKKSLPISQQTSTFTLPTASSDVKKMY